MRAVFLVLLLLAACAKVGPSEGGAGEMSALKLSSPAFMHNGKIPSKYTCDGENINPELKIEGVPENSKSLALLMDDPDVPKNIRADGMWDHWVVFNIPSDAKVINEGESPQGIEGKNSGGKTGYQGPCPPDREHRYFFKLYALDTTLSLPEGATKADVEKAMQGHIIAKTELVGKYSRE